MSRYAYDYALAPSRSTGWRSGLASILTVGAIVAISAISGGAVVLNLLGPGRTEAERPATATTRALTASVPVARAVTPSTPRAASAPVNAAAVTPSQVPAPQPSSPAATAPAPQPAPAPSVAAVEEPAIAQVPERELTFTHGYARRHAVQAAAEAAAPKIEGARAEAQTQPGRAARFRAVARAPQDHRRVADARDEAGLFGRSDPPERFDFGRHQALAFGDPRDPRAYRRPPPQGGGLFSRSPGGFFGGLF